MARWPDPRDGLPAEAQRESAAGHPPQLQQVLDVRPARRRHEAAGPQQRLRPRPWQAFRWLRLASFAAALAMLEVCVGWRRRSGCMLRSQQVSVAAAVLPPGSASPATSSSAAEGGEERRRSVVRVVAMSDTHGFHKELKVPDGDLLVHCGDAASAKRRPREKPEDNMIKFAKWFNKLPFEEKVFIEGNHEEGRFAKAALGTTLFEPGEDLCLGLNIYCQPYSRGGKGRGYSKLPPSIDLLLTHEPPKGILDRVTFKQSKYKVRPGEDPLSAGSRTLRKALDQLNGKGPRLHIFGHIHEARGVWRENGTLYVNAANANAGMANRLEHGCMVIDLPVDGGPAVIVEGHDTDM